MLNNTGFLSTIWMSKAESRAWSKMKRGRGPDVRKARLLTKRLLVEIPVTYEEVRVKKTNK